MKKQKIWLAALLLILPVLATACSSYRVGGKALSQVSQESAGAFVILADNMVTMLSGEDATHLNSLSSAASVTFDEEWEQWQQYLATYGPYQDHQFVSAWNYGDETVTTVQIQLEKGSIYADASWNVRNRITKMAFYEDPEAAEAAVTLPEGVTEQEITLNEGGDFPLAAKITRPEADGVYPAVVLIAGTGSNDMDQKAGNTRVYRDLAWYLASHGIVVIRYDKRIATYGEEWNRPTMENMSVDWEYIDDAVAATRILEEQPYVDADRIFVLGHSISGLTLPRTDEKASGVYAGYILLSTPSRAWQEAAFDQYINYGLAGVEKKNLYYTCSLLESELKDINGNLDQYSENRLLNESLLGMPGAYWKDLNSMDYIAAYEQTDKPMLILQGSADYQIVPDVDYEGWQKLMEGHANCECRLYDGLNHLFTPSEGCFQSCSKEYDMPNHMDETVMEDIAAFIR